MPDSVAHPADHPLRAALNDELHARPHLRVETPSRLTHVAWLADPAEAAADLDRLAGLCARHGTAAPGPEDRHGQMPVGDRLLRWERHAEFVTVTVLAPGPGDGGWSALTPELEEWTAGIAGGRLAALHLRVEADTEPRHGPESLAALFPGGQLAGSVVNGGDALAWTDFHVGEDGCSRMLVRDVALTPARTGRLVQRLLEIETYRMMALLGLPDARALTPALSEMEARLAAIVERTAAAGSTAEEHALLDRLTLLAAEVEAAAGRTRFRFGATAAYAALVERRLQELREERIPGLPRIGVFLERRFGPAVRTCEAARRRLAELAEGVGRAGAMLRTRVDVQLAEQNAELLRSMEARARAQLRIQEAVEGLSVVAITYYLIGLLKVVAEGLPALGLHLDHHLLAAGAVPLVLGAAWVGLRRLRRALKAD